MPIILDDGLAADVHNALCRLVLMEDEFHSHEAGDEIAKIWREYDACFKRRVSSQLAFPSSGIKSRPSR